MIGMWAESGIYRLFKDACLVHHPFIFFIVRICRNFNDHRDGQKHGSCLFHGSSMPYILQINDSLYFE